MPDFLSVAQFAALHGKDPGNVRRLIQQGRIPAQKIGSQWSIPSDALPPADRRVKSGKYQTRPKSGEAEETRDMTPVEIEVEIPAWLDRFATDAGLDLSQVLQDALKKQFNLQ